MGGNEWFPLAHRRLRKSKWWRRATDLARARNVMLWGEAYDATPAGSLPNDDDELAEAAGFGMDIESFLGAKDEIMAPWVLCADDRWYHPTVCEVVMAAWESAGERRRQSKERQANRRNKVRNGAKSHAKTTNGHAKTDNVTRDSDDKPRDTGYDIPPVTQSHALEERRREENISEANASSSTTDVDLFDESAEKPSKYPSAFDESWKAYPHVRGRSSKPKSLGAWRRLAPSTRQQLPSAIARFAREGREPKADCGAPAMERWLAKEQYLDWTEDAAPPPAQTLAFQGPAELRAAVVLRMGEEWTRGYLDPCHWLDLPDRAILSSNSFVVDRLRREVGAEFDALGIKILLEKGEAA